MNLFWDSEASGRRLLWLSWLVLAVLVAVVLLTRTLTPIDETRYVGAAWEMWLRGDFLVPFKNGEPYSHKPPFFFWMFHVGWALFGINEWWPRLVAPLFSAGASGLVFLLARRLWPQQPATAGLSALMLTTSLWWMLFSTTTMFDVLLAFWVLVGMHGVLAAADGRRWGFAGLGVAIGMGALTKGPVILLHLLPITLLAPWWNPGLPRRRWFGGVVLALLLGAVIALAWAIPAGLSGGEAYRNAIFWGQTANRMVASFAHKQPIWWYLPMLPLLLFPWFVWPDLWRALAGLKREGLDRGARFCLAWLLPVLIAFSLVSGKQQHYLIPLFPAFAMLAARGLVARPARRVVLPVLLVALLGVLLALAGAGVFRARLDGLAALPRVWPGVLIGVAALVAWQAVRRGCQPSVALALLSALALSLTLISVQPAIEPLYDIKPMAQAIRKVQQRGATVVNLQGYHAQYQFLGRLEAPLVELGDDPAQQLAWLKGHPDAYVVVYFRDAHVLNTIPALHQQIYRGGAVALVSAQEAATLLGAEGGQRHALMR
ncbi:ArnT family glycosyltransferase [Hydrogenophaga taeniospiralis]|uniref:ArnT family glycosyltransferase n=1 Tax=Hydrogenophaga taeniospiralis TaxID=65656 RepID=UPI001CFBFF7F|nr:glycosyltransferase family 39 protein [Hydrogenophaga taeniospiralis]UCU93610.1 glycosyltransferase family 39 protein [Hydrogenophaga taeniospiralis]